MTDRLQAVDTSVAVPLLVASHRAHGTVAAWSSGRTMYLCGPTLPEAYSVLTRLPGSARVAATDAVTPIDENLANVMTLTAETTGTGHHEFARRSMAGGAVYDVRRNGCAREQRDSHHQGRAGSLYQ